MTMWLTDPKGYINNKVQQYKKTQSKIDKPMPEVENPLGTQYDFLADYFRKILKKGDSNIPVYRQIMQGAINTGYDRSLDVIRESLAGRGMYGSGAGASAVMGLEGERMGALAKGEGELSRINQSAVSDAMMNLLRLNEFEGIQNTRVAGMESNWDMNQIENWLRLIMQQREMDWQESNQPSWIGQIVGSIIGGASQVGTAAILK